MLDDLQARATNARQQVEALERERDDASPERIAAIDAELRRARAAEQEARYDFDSELERENSITGAAAASAAIDAAEVERQQQSARNDAPAAPDNVTRKYVYQGARVRVWAGVPNKVIDHHSHPDIVEARIANAKSAAFQQQLEQERDQRTRAEEKAEARALKDQDRAARIFEGGHARGLSTKDYLRIEEDHRRETIQYAENAQANEQRREAEQAAVDTLTQETGIEHLAVEPGAELEGEIAAVVEVRGERFYTIEFQDDGGQVRRFVIPANGHDYQVGDVIEVTRDPQRGVDIREGTDYGYDR
ncbi:hypothetical protein [Burkholderia vietnamiensis]|uniref:hypothetical protein n=1 Tax=Burkholderia vietnamiensis TaxID=60552 RepID=UPI00158D4CAC|nr:hypothetical protein [Burkholderia vietnamiensis]